jgi:hypothetical protein
MKRFFVVLVGLALALPVTSAQTQFPQPDGGNLERGTLPQHWLSQAPKCMEIPEWQVHEYNPDFYILRQSPCTDYEKPFVFLLFGKERAMLVDTGSRNGNLVPALERTVKDWLTRKWTPQHSLLVVHTPRAWRPHLGRQGNPGDEGSRDAGHVGSRGD